MTQNYSEVFSTFQKYMEEEENTRDSIRVIVREMEQKSREIITLLQAVHKPKGMAESSFGQKVISTLWVKLVIFIPQTASVTSICQNARDQFSAVKNFYVALQEKVPVDEFYRYHEHWRFVTQRFVFSAAFIVYLETGRLIGREEAAEFLGISAKPTDRFHVELDDFLLGLLLLADELTRLSLNCATHGDYNRPVQIAEFVSEMNVGFRLLNLKNDLLRKKFDGLKYNLKKVEEVIYDLSIRGLKPSPEEKSMNP